MGNFSKERQKFWLAHDTELIWLVKLGMKAEDIGAILGVSKSAVIGRIDRRWGERLKLTYRPIRNGKFFKARPYGSEVLQALVERFGRSDDVGSLSAGRRDDRTAIPGQLGSASAAARERGGYC